MNTRSQLLRGFTVLCLLSSVLCFTGCISQPIEAASTRLKVTNVTGKSVEITLPKNLDATKLKLTINPTSGEYELSADKIVTDASTVIDSAAAAQAQAMASLGNAISSLVPLIQSAKAPALPFSFAPPAAPIPAEPEPVVPPSPSAEEAK